MLGLGASGWVVRARQISLGRDVAVKTVLISDDARPALRRLEREGRVLAGLDHPGIVRIHRLIPTPTAVFLVMEALSGPTLAVADLDPAGMLTALSGVAVALQAVHEQGLVHRDVKPANVIVEPGRGPVLVDFGLTRLPVARSAFRSEVGVVAGTPLFMAPEQWTAPEAATPAIDAYAFAVMAYEKLLGHYPLRADSVVQVQRAHCFSQPTDPRLHAPELPAAAAAVWLAALAKNPAYRVSPMELCATLRELPLTVWPRGYRIGSPLPTGVSATGTAAPEYMATGVSASELAPVITSGTGLQPTNDTVASPEHRISSVKSTTEWVSPSVYRPPPVGRRRSHQLIALVCLVGLIVGLVAVGLWRM